MNKWQSQRCQWEFDRPVDVLWPLFGVEDRNDGYLRRFLPFYVDSVEGDTRSRLISPFYYQVDGPRGRQRWMMLRKSVAACSSSHCSKTFTIAMLGQGPIT